jgi:tRNA(Ile)-lysidine synthase
MPTFNKFQSNALLRQVAKFVRTENLIQPDDSVLAGVSGGPDSIALLYILMMLQPYMFRTLGVAHLNHGIRSSEADRDAEFISNLCRKLNIAFHAKRINVSRYASNRKLNLEEAARICRYDFFRSLIQNEGYTKIALGHQANDNAELVLMRILRSSGTLGISGMSAIRDKTIIRPLLKVTQSEIMDFITTNRLTHVFDSTNFDITLTRNRIRHRLIPTLKREYNPNIVTALNTLATVVQGEDEWMSRITKSFFLKILCKRTSQKIILTANELLKVHRALARRVLRQALFELKGNLKRINLIHIESILNLLTFPKGYQQLNLPDGILAEHEYNKLQLSIILPSVSKQIQSIHSKDSKKYFRYMVHKPKNNPIIIHITEIGYCIKFSALDQKVDGLLDDTGQNIAFFDMDRLIFPLTIRNPNIGDRYSPLGMNGTQKLKNYFINAKVPRSQRKDIPILVSGDYIIWIIGHRLSHISRIRSNTKHILKAEIYLPKTQ